jgi:translation initiation factor 4E
MLRLRLSSACGFRAASSPSQLLTGSNYHMFKKGISPEWEDDANKRGGKWTIALQRRGGDPAAAKQADDAWLHTLLALIGEQFGPDSDEICGVVIGPRAKETRLALWTKSGDDESMCKRIGAFFKANIGHEAFISYQLHDESIKKQTSYRNEAVYKV